MVYIFVHLLFLDFCGFKPYDVIVLCFFQSFVELFMLPELLHFMCNCNFTVWQILTHIGVFFVPAIPCLALFIVFVQQEAETQQNEFHKKPKKLCHLCFKYVSRFVLLINHQFDSCEVGSMLLCL